MPTPPSDNLLPPGHGLPPLSALPYRLARLCLGMASFVAGPCGHEPAGATWIVACSGGPDSVALLAMAAILRRRLGLAGLMAAHLDHGLRPESGAEAQAVGALCRELGIGCLSDRADVAALARQGRLGVEDAGRQARQAFFADCLAGRDNAWVLTGHQLNDLAEDQLMRVTRGAGWPALGGMAALDPARRLLRPLLLTPRSAITDFTAALGLPTIDDPSNADPAFLRNRVRHVLLPLLLEENPRALDAAARLWRQARLDAAYFDEVLPAPLPDEGGAVRLPRALLSGLHPALRARLYARALDALGSGQALADGLIALEAAYVRRDAGRVFQFPGGKTARVARTELVFSRAGPAGPAGRPPRLRPDRP
jgi:tRNA(Ile)-lysidine synthetase-like protein